MTRIVRLRSADAEAIRGEGQHGYPEEVCGVLLGRDENGTREIAGIRAVENAREDQRSRRYTITAETLRAAEREAAALGLEVVGFYHSHPDHPADPSEYDRAHSWPWYTYFIVSVRDGQAAELKAWRLLDDRTAFEQLDVEVIGSGV